mmetsp:Transcript_5816/g.16585  ORF Transcript_5816/g.16585 Transcript_5816/m.16585 type:complete len:336 (+) Transcript_5816:119-1126(+)
MIRLLILGLVLIVFSAEAFQSNLVVSTKTTTKQSSSTPLYTKSVTDDELSNGTNSDRRSFLSKSTIGFACAAATTSSFFSGRAFAAEEEEESFASIAARAQKLSAEAGDRVAATAINNGGGDTRTAYDFELPVAGKSIPFRELIRQEVDEEGRAKCKVILVTNMKEDDPIARKDIPEFISLAAKYGRDGEFAVIMTPTDQGYYEPDTSQLIRLKLASEYGYGINPATIVTDKTDILGKKALPFWRWMQSNCRTPAGLGRVEGNFEKFLIDGRTGMPLRRYPRKYKPTNIKNDIEAIIAGRPLPPAGANFLEEWRTAAVEAEANTYRFQKGLNYYD